MNENIPKTEPADAPDRPTAEATPDSSRAARAGESALAVTPPKELGLMLVSAGLIGVVLPGPGAPALVAGGLILWPDAFSKVERWARRRFPQAHRKGIGHINRFLSDLERRYPGSTGTAGTGRRIGDVLNASARPAPSPPITEGRRDHFPPVLLRFNWRATCILRVR